MLKNLTKHSKWTPLFLAYMVLIHLALIGLFFKTQGSAKATAKFAPEASSASNTTDTANAPNPHVPNMLQYHGWVNSSAPEGAAIFLGDSITQGLATAAITPYAINFGIGFQTSAQLLSNLPAYSSLSKARVLFLEIGTNDLAMGQSAGLAERYAKIIQTLPPNTPLIWSGVMPQRLWHSSPNLCTSASVVSGRMSNTPSRIGEHPATLVIFSFLPFRSRSFSCIARPVFSLTIRLM